MNIIEELEAIELDDEGQECAWKNEIAKDLNTLLGRAIYEMETSGDETDIDLAGAVLRVVKRLKEAEELK